LCRELVARGRDMAGMRIAADNGEFEATLSTAGGPVAHVTRGHDLVVTLPPEIVAALRDARWIIAETTGATLVHGPRNAAEREIAWSILLAARDFAPAASADAITNEAEVAPHPIVTPLAPLAEGAAAP
jgi:hypothetical protein